MASKGRGNDNFLGTYEDDMSLLESGLYKNKSYDDQSAEAGAGKSNINIDLRLLMLLKFFKELYVREAELFKKIFPGIQDEFADFFRKFGGVLSQVKMKQRKVKTMQRSLSLGSHRVRTRGIGGGESPVRPERFKVRTVVVDDDGVGQGQGGQAGQGDTKSASTSYNYI